MLKNPNLDTELRQLYTSKLNEVNNTMKKIEDMFAPRGECFHQNNDWGYVNMYDRKKKLKEFLSDDEYEVIVQNATNFSDMPLPVWHLEIAKKV